MSTYSSELIRQGLPRTPGGAAWPDVSNAAGPATPVEAKPAGAPVSAESVSAATVEAESAATAAAAAPDAATAAAAPDSAAPDSAAPDLAAASLTDVTLRQGLPRVTGGDPWPPAGVASVAGVSTPAAAATLAATSAPAAQAEAAASAEGAVAAASAAPASAAAPSADTVAAAAASAAPATPAPAPAAAAVETVAEEVTLRQGLPRVAGGEPWPEAATVVVERVVAPLAASTPAPATTAADSAADSVAADATQVSATEAAVAAKVESEPEPEPVTVQVSPAAAPEAAASVAAKQTPAPEPAPTPAASKPAPAQKPAPAPKPKREPVMIGSRTLGNWIKLIVLWGVGAIVAAGIIVLAARGLTTLPGVPEFLQRYPGEYELPEFVDPGFPAWARWTHFLNFFLIVLIIRSGLLVRKQQRPDAFFTPKKGGKKISIYLWMHTSLDLLWLLNGLVFVVLLFATGHWARIVPTSWEVFPNALSAGIQYLTLQWPVEDGWVNYNSLQQLMYFTVVFIAAPLAAITGVRMSEWWPQDAEKLNKAYPAPIARAIHYPVMLFFVLFILIHVFLVFTTGALKNLNHMFVGTPEVSWVGFWWFAAAVLVTAAVTWAARPLVLAPIANLFGRVSER